MKFDVPFSVRNSEDLTEYVRRLDLPMMTEAERHELFDGEWHEGVKSECEVCDDVAMFTGTCQHCGFYWDVRQRTVCTCGGEVL